MMDLAMVLVSLVLAGAYACRVELLSWVGQPLMMLIHVIGGATAVAVLALVSQTGGTVWHAAMLLCSGSLLVATYRAIPKGAK